MTNTYRQVIQSGYRIGSVVDPSDAQMQQILSLLHQPVERGERVLGGRRRVTVGAIDGIGSVVVKHYARGGYLGNFISRMYLRWGKTRSRREFELLQFVRGLGVMAPEPIASVHFGGLFYKTWLFTREIVGHTSLAELSLEHPQSISRFMPQVIRQVETLIRNKVFHVDLHPGNVLIAANEQVFFVDFDKAETFSGSHNDLRDRYLCRWRRAVIKHQLPEALSEELCARLRKKFHGISTPSPANS